MKMCQECNKNKNLENFSKDKSRKDGLQRMCKQCYRDYCTKNKERIAIQQAKGYKENRETVRAKQKIYNDGRKEEKAITDAAYYDKNKQKVDAAHADYKKNNPSKINALVMKRKIAKQRATPVCLTLEQSTEIEEVYELAKELQWLSEEPLQVDHTVPIQGKNVSGLHVPQNLQILPKSINNSKKNKFNQIEHDRINLPLLIKKLSQNP